MRDEKDEAGKNSGRGKESLGIELLIHSQLNQARQIVKKTLPYQM